MQNVKEGRAWSLLDGWRLVHAAEWMEPPRTATSPGEKLPRSTAERVRLAGQRAARTRQRLRTRTKGTSRWVREACRVFCRVLPCLVLPWFGLVWSGPILSCCCLGPSQQSKAKQTKADQGRGHNATPSRRLLASGSGPSFKTYPFLLPNPQQKLPCSQPDGD